MWNTANRLNMEYSKLFKDLIEKKFKNNLEFTYANLIFKEEDSKSELTRSSLKLDQHYDVNQLGVNAGYLTVYFYDKTVTKVRAKELLLELKEEMDKNKLNFYSVYFYLSKGKPKKSNDLYVVFDNILYSDFENPAFEQILLTKTKVDN